MVIVSQVVQATGGRKKPTKLLKCSIGKRRTIIGFVLGCVDLLMQL